MAEQEKPKEKEQTRGKKSPVDQLKAIYLGMSKNEKIIFYATVLVLVFFLLDRLIMLPLTKRIESLDDAINAQITTTRDGLLILGYKDRIMKEYDQVKGFFVESRRSSEEELAEFLKEMESTAIKSEVRLATINPSGEIENIKFYTKYEIKLEGVGTFENIVKFVYAISNSEKLVKVETLELIPPSRGSDEMKFNMTVSGMVITL